MYASLRREELRALRWEDVDLASGVIRVRRSWDRVAGEIETKSSAGFLKVPIAAVVRSRLVAHRLDAGGVPGALVFPSDRGAPLCPSTVSARAMTAWRAHGLAAITLHECRHTFASLMIAAGVNALLSATRRVGRRCGTTVGHSQTPRRRRGGRSAAAPVCQRRLSGTARAASSETASSCCCRPRRAR